MLKRITLSLIIVMLGAVYYYSFNVIYNSSMNSLLNQQVEVSKNQADIVSRILSERVKKNDNNEEIITELQNSIENSSTENSFICMFNSSGKELCHPDQKKIGKILSDNNSNIKSISNNKLIKNFKTAVREQKSIGGLREMDEYTEIVYLSPVPGSDWIIASHSNIINLKTILANLKEKLVLISLLLWLSSSLIIFFFLNYNNSLNRTELSELNRTSSNKYFNELQELNTSISKQSSTDKRLLADKGNKLAPVYINTIAFVYTQDKITYIIDLDNEKTTINMSLDELYKSFDKSMFFRASRKVILSAKAIKKIEKHGTTQLKVLTFPVSPIEIIISKYKLVEFKKWAGKN